LAEPKAPAPNKKTIEGGNLRKRSSILTAVALALAVTGTAFAQEAQHISGRVIDGATKEAIPAVTVTVTGTPIGVVTTDSGRFALRNVPSNAKSLSIRRIGYQSTTVELVAGQTDYTVSLTRDVLQLEQEVITGVATTISSKNSASYAPVITNQEINAAPTPTLENAMQGKIAGVQVDENSGAPGGGLQIQVRGVTSIYANAQPLYVIDGVIYSNATFESSLNSITGAFDNVTNGPSNQDQSVNRAADLNPNDIESIQVLEGGAASAIYGAKAAAGVVIITTKKGTPGKTSIDATQKFGSYELENQLPVRRYSLASADTVGEAAGLTAAQVADNYNACHGFCNFQTELYGGGELSYETDLDVHGGTNQTTYYLSGLSKYDNGAEINTGYHKQAVRANINQNFGPASSPTLTAAAQISYTTSLTERGVNGNDNYGIAGYDVISYTPSFFDMMAQPGGVYALNPFGFHANAFADAYQIQTPDETNRATLGANLDWHMFTNRDQALDVIFQGGADFTNERDQFYAPSTLEIEQCCTPFPGASTYGDAYNRLYNYSFSIVHKFTGLSWMNATTSIGSTHDENLFYNPVAVAFKTPPSTALYPYGVVQQQFDAQQQVISQGFYGQEQVLLFGERLALTGGVNAEANTNDGNVNAYYLFPKGAASYRFISPFKGLDEFKLRFAYGQAGTQPLYGVRFAADTIVTYAGNSGETFEETKGDPSIRPEINTTLETGFDATFFQSRAQVTATVYQKRITDLLLQGAVPASSGFNTEWFNGGEFTDQGLELTLSATPVQFRNFSWSTNVNYSRNQSVVNSLPVPSFYAGNFFAASPFGAYRIAVGKSVSALWGYRMVNGTPTLMVIGDANPAFTLGWGEDLNMGPLHLHALFDWREGMWVSDLTQNYFDGNNTSANLVQEQQRLTEDGNGLSPYLQPASFLKLRELTLKYDLPGTLIRTIGRNYVHSATLVLSGRNLITWTRYQGLDPEVSNFGAQNIGRGQDVTPYPPTRSFFGSIELGL
jgi:TonB-dependent starch-binding outer membrane protein SusC